MSATDKKVLIKRALAGVTMNWSKAHIGITKAGLEMLLKHHVQMGTFSIYRYRYIDII